jgi:L-ascorbate metabolism protein UlaG (beta-lactamase superfamily)
MGKKNYEDTVKWLGHASVRIEADKTIYIDPWEIKSDSAKADIVCITHSHYDHYSPENIQKLLKDDTTVLAPQNCSLGEIDAKIITVSPNQKLKVDGINIQTVPAYNKNKNFHPKEEKGVGYIIEVGNLKIYHAGDTDFIAEMETIHPDVALLPIGGTYTMNAREAASAANVMKPKLAIPIHFGSIVGSDDDALEFQRLCECEVKILIVSK